MFLEDNNRARGQGRVVDEGVLRQYRAMHVTMWGNHCL